MYSWILIRYRCEGYSYSEGYRCNPGIVIFVRRVTYNRIYVRKSQENKFLGEKLEIKTLVNKSQFFEVLWKKITGNKVLSFRFLGLFPPQNNIGSQKIISQELKSKKNSFVLGQWDQVLKVFIERTFLLCIFISNIPRVFIISSPLFHGCIMYTTYFGPMHFHWKILFLYKMKSQNGRTLFPETFYFKDFFPQDFFVPKFRTLFRKLFFKEFFWRLPV